MNEELSGWVKCKDALPKEEGLYFWFDGKSVTINSFYPMIMSSHLFADQVYSHWMPLKFPQPPEQE